MKSNYEAKFADFLQMCADAKKKKIDVVMVHGPEVLGDDYGELVESLNRLSDASLSLRILPRAERGK